MRPSHCLPAEDPRTALVRCEDCASRVWEGWGGAPPSLTLTVEVEHAPTCPVWRDPDREIAMQLTPPPTTNTTTTN